MISLLFFLFLIGTFNYFKILFEMYNFSSLFFLIEGVSLLVFLWSIAIYWGKYYKYEKNKRNLCIFQRMKNKSHFYCFCSLNKDNDAVRPWHVLMLRHNIPDIAMEKEYILYFKFKFFSFPEELNKKKTVINKLCKLKNCVRWEKTNLKEIIYCRRKFEANSPEV